MSDRTDDMHVGERWNIAHPVDPTVTWVATVIQTWPGGALVRSLTSGVCDTVPPCIPMGVAR